MVRYARGPPLHLTECLAQDASPGPEIIDVGAAVGGLVHLVIDDLDELVQPGLRLDRPRARVLGQRVAQQLHPLQRRDNHLAECVGLCAVRWLGHQRTQRHIDEVACKDPRQQSGILGVVDASCAAR